jgi:hypothetical protein
MRLEVGEGGRRVGEPEAGNGPVRVLVGTSACRRGKDTVMARISLDPPKTLGYGSVPGCRAADTGSCSTQALPSRTTCRWRAPVRCLSCRWSGGAASTAAAVIRDSAAANGTPIALFSDTPQNPTGPPAPTQSSSWKASRMACHLGTACAARRRCSERSAGRWVRLPLSGP